MKPFIDKRFVVSPFFVFFLIYSSQVDVGMLTFQRTIARSAGYDAWMSVIICGLSIQAVIWMMYRILGTGNRDVVHINPFCFGQWIGGMFNLCIMLYYLFAAFVVFRSYIEVIQVWMFPLMSTWQISIIILLLIYYIVSSGFRVITGICFWGAVLPFLFLFPLIFSPLEFAHFNNLLPLFHHSAKEIFESSKSMLFQFQGFETLFMFYPFIKNAEKSQKWAHYGTLFSILLYLLVTIVTFVYFSEGQLKHTLWPTLTLLKIAQVPIIERFEYIVVSLWLLVVLPTITLHLWSACRGVRKMVQCKQRILLLIFLMGFGLLTNIIEDRNLIRRFTAVYSEIGFYFIYVYIPLLFVAVHIRQKWMKPGTVTDEAPKA